MITRNWLKILAVYLPVALAMSAGGYVIGFVLLKLPAWLALTVTILSVLAFSLGMFITLMVLYIRSKRG